jgi:hypothetical protein
LRLGVNVPTEGVNYYSMAKFFRGAEMRDVLDAITVIHECVHGTTFFPFWVDHVTKAFEEENVCYRLGKDGIVHPFVDAEFDANRAAALELLRQERFGEARQDFEAAFRHLRNREGKQAIRMMFPAVEVAAKVLYPGTISRLMPNEVDRIIRPKFEQRYVANPPALQAGRHLLDAFKAWVIASQQYRHGQEVQDPAEPPQEFVIAFLSSGASFLRWLIEFSE